MSFLFANPSSYKAIHQFLDANDISYENQHQDFINHLHKKAHTLQHPQYRGSRDTWECKFFSEVRRNSSGVSADVYREALKEWLKEYKPGNGPELNGIISELGGKFIRCMYFLPERLHIFEYLALVRYYWIVVTLYRATWKINLGCRRLTMVT